MARGQSLLRTTVCSSGLSETAEPEALFVEHDSVL